MKGRGHCVIDTDTSTGLRVPSGVSAVSITRLHDSGDA